MQNKAVCFIFGRKSIVVDGGKANFRSAIEVKKCLQYPIYAVIPKRLALRRLANLLLMNDKLQSLLRRAPAIFVTCRK